MTSNLQSVTAFGRQMIARSKELVEQEYCIANGYPYDAKVRPVHVHCVYVHCDVHLYSCSLLLHDMYMYIHVLPH